MKRHASVVAGALLAGTVALTGAARVQAAAPPSAALAQSAMAVAGQSVTLNASGSTGTIDRFRWDFGDGTYDIAGAMEQHTYTTSGTYTVTVDAVGDGTDSYASITVTVAPAVTDTTTVAPIVLGPDQTGTLPVVVPIDGPSTPANEPGVMVPAE